MAGIAIAVATLVGAWLRTSLAHSSGLWRDEVQSLAISQLPTIRDVVTFLAREDSHPPLFYLVERLWVRFFGASDAAVAALGLVPGVLVIPSAAWVAWSLTGRRAGVLAAWYVAVSWPLVWHSGDGRPYSFLSLATLLTATAGLLAASRADRRWWLGYGLGSLILVYTHNWWILVAAGLAALTGHASWRRRREDRGRLRRWLVTHTVLGVCYLIWLPVVLGQGRVAGYAAMAEFPVEWFILAPVLVLGAAVPLLLPLVAALVLGQVRSDGAVPVTGTARFLGLSAALPCLAALGAWKFTDLTITHCAAALSAVALTAVACGLGRAGRQGGSARRLFASILVLGILVGALDRQWFRKSDIREAAAEVSRSTRPRDLVIVYPSSIGPVFQRYLSSGSRVGVFPPQEPIAPTSYRHWWRRFDDSGSLAEAIRQIDNARKEGREVWFVNQLRVDRSPDSSAPVGTRERFRYSVGARRADLEGRLLMRYGPPDTLQGWRPHAWSREMVEVRRYRGSRR